MELVDLESHPEPLPDGEVSHSNTSVERQSVEENNPKEFTLANFIRHPDNFIDRSYHRDSFKGFFSILFSIPTSKKVKNIYKFALTIFFFISFLYPLIVFIIEKEHPTYNLVSSSFSLIGLVYGLCNILIFSYVIPWYQSCGPHQSRINPTPVGLSKPRKAFEDPEGVHMSEIKDDKLKDIGNTNKEPKEAVIGFIRDTLGELFIYPSIICVLFGFINERGWEFDNTIVVFDFILLLYSILTDAFHAKIIHIWHLVEVIRATYNKYDDIESSKSHNWTTKLCRHFSPFSLALPYAVIQVLIHWLMLAIIGVRIYVDNFTRRINDTTDVEIGEYKTTAYTRYMIFCGAYLLIASTFVYLVLNKYWFFEIYNIISTEKDHHIPLSVKLLAFMRDPIAYILVTLQVVPFIPFAVGSFLPDYDSSEFEVAPGLRTAAEMLGWCFIGLFLLSNMQAVVICVCLSIVFGILAIILAMFATVIAAFLLGYILLLLRNCLVLCYESSKDDSTSNDIGLFSGCVEYTEFIWDCCKCCFENFDADCIGSVFEHLDWCWCTCDPDDA